MSPTVVAARNSAGERERDVVTEIVECVLEDLDAVARGSNREGLIVLRRVLELLVVQAL